LRAAIRWGQAQTPPLIDKSPFHRFGVRLNTKVETIPDRWISRDEEKGLLDAAMAMNTWEHRSVGSLMHDRIIGALELCCRLGEMLLIQNKRVDWDTHTIGIPGGTTKDRENRRIPFDPEGRLAAVLHRRGKLGPETFVFGTENGEYVSSFKTAWESLLLIANGHDTKRDTPGARVDRAKLRQIDLHWHDLRHEGACRLPDGRRGHPHHPVDARSRERATDAALLERDRRGVAEGTRGRLETTDAQSRRRRPQCMTACHTCVTRDFEMWRARQDSNLRPSAPEADALSS
jgi:integrase